MYVHFTFSAVWVTLIAPADSDSKWQIEAIDVIEIFNVKSEQ